MRRLALDLTVILLGLPFVSAALTLALAESDRAWSGLPLLTLAAAPLAAAGWTIRRGGGPGQTVLWTIATILMTVVALFALFGVMIAVFPDDGGCPDGRVYC